MDLSQSGASKLFKYCAMDQSTGGFLILHLEALQDKFTELVGLIRTFQRSRCIKEGWNDFMNKKGL